MTIKRDKYSQNFCCNDCDRGFKHESAWRYHGERTGHDINGDLRGHHQKEVGELQGKIQQLETAYRLLSEERAKMSEALAAIDNTMFLLRERAR